MTRDNLKRIMVGLGIAVVHFMASAASLMLVLGDTTGPRPAWLRPLDHVLPVVTLVLCFPMMALRLPARVFFEGMIVNSFLWGAALVMLWDWWSRRRMPRMQSQ
jgi:hypothetical protein